MNRWVLVTGATRGLGLGVAREMLRQKMNVIFVGRKLDQVQAAIRESEIPEGCEAIALEAEMSRIDTLYALVENAKSRVGAIDILINNAGILSAEDDGRIGRLTSRTSLQVPPSVVLETFQINTLAPFVLIQGFLPDMIEQGFGRVVNVSSAMAQLSVMARGTPGYRISKTALNAVTRVFQNEVPLNKDVLINSVCPGWVRTDMGGVDAPRELAMGVASITWAALLPSSVDAPRGGYFRDGMKLDW